MSQPFFTVILPNYKTEAFLEECLNSVKNQTFTDFECILVNDGSPGLSEVEYHKSIQNSDFNNRLDISKLDQLSQWKAIYESEIGNDIRFRTIDKENGGQGSCKNIALDQAKGRFALFLDCDDVFHVEHLNSVYKEITKYKDDWDSAVFLFDQVKEFSVQNGKKIWKTEPMIEQIPKRLSFENYLVLNQNGHTCSTIQISILNPTRFTWLTKSMEGVEIIYRLASRLQSENKKLEFISISINTIYRRLHPGSMTFADSQAGFEKEKIDKINAYTNLLENETLTFRQKILCRLGVWRFSLVNKYGLFGKLLKKYLLLLPRL